MRRLHGLLIAAGLVAAPFSAAAGPNSTKAGPNKDDQAETFEWSMSTSHARLGVMALGLTPELRKHFGVPDDRGVMIARVEPKSAAAAAGLQVGDILIEAKGRAIDSAADVIDALSTAHKDETVPLSLFRDGKPLVLSAKMQNDPLPPMRMHAFKRGEWPGFPSWMNDFFEHGPSQHGKLTPDSPAS